MNYTTFFATFFHTKITFWKTFSSTQFSICLHICNISIKNGKLFIFRARPKAKKSSSNQDELSYIANNQHINHHQA